VIKMDIKKLTIIMPCYNCQDTLEEAVDSIYTQNIDIPFEIVMVDDSSIDTTRDIIKCLADQYKEIKYIFHQENRRGGAARNTAVANSDGDIIFCLDSDDILPSNMLNKMIQYMSENKCDGVVIGKSIFFVGDIGNIRNEVLYEEKKLKFEDLFSEVPVSVTGNFLYTRETFDIAGGYPETHGFDTQCYGYRVLANNLNIQVCKDAYYYQRIPQKKSNYIRQLEAGNVSKNWFYILSENFYKFSDEVKELILNYDYKSYHNNTGLKNIILDLYKCQNKFDRQMLSSNYSEAYNSISKSEKPYDLFWCGVYDISNKDFNRANVMFNKAQQNGWTHWAIYHLLVSNLYVRNVNIDYDELFENMKYFSPRKRTDFENFMRFISRVKNKLIRMVKGSK